MERSFLTQYVIFIPRELHKNSAGGLKRFLCFLPELVAIGVIYSLAFVILVACVLIFLALSLIFLTCTLLNSLSCFICFANNELLLKNTSYCMDFTWKCIKDLFKLPYWLPCDIWDGVRALLQKKYCSKIYDEIQGELKHNQKNPEDSQSYYSVFKNEDISFGNYHNQQNQCLVLKDKKI